MDPNGVVYRILPPSEYERLVPFCARNKMPLPIEGYNIVCVAEDSGVIVARWDILMQPHLDNGCIEPEYRSKCLGLSTMFKLLESQIKGKGFQLYSTSLNAKAHRLLRRLGFKQYEAPLFTKEY